MINIEQLKAFGTYSLTALILNGEFQAAVYGPYPIVTGDVKFEVPKVYILEYVTEWTGEDYEVEWTGKIVDKITCKTILDLEDNIDEGQAEWFCDRLNIAALFAPGIGN